MQKELLETAYIPELHMQLSYYLVKGKDGIGIAIRENEDPETVCFVPDYEKNVRQLIKKLAAHTVMPVSLYGIVEDYIKEKLQKRTPQLLHAEPYPPFYSR